VPDLNVDEFVDARASRFNRVQQGRRLALQTVQLKASEIHAFLSISTSGGYMVRDQEAGGSNPLAPTFFSSISAPEISVGC
jgi:hypothetical protein